MPPFARFVCFLVIAPGCVASSDTGSIDQPIIGGTITSTTVFPTTVGIEDGPGDWFCTGTLVDQNWVLTAAHCVTDETTETLRVRFDDDNLNDMTGGKVVAAAEIHAHPGYQDLEAHDLALIKLASPVTDRKITPSHRELVAPGTMVTEVGYGYSTNRGRAGVLHKLETPTSDCATAAAEVDDLLLSNANLMCFDASDGTASCFGDSGGPAYVAVAGGLEVAGVTSFGTGNDACTGPHAWDVYTAVAAELAFIDRYVQPDSAGSGSGNAGGGTDTRGSGSNNNTLGGGGCSAGGGQGGFAVLVAMMMLSCAAAPVRRCRDSHAADRRRGRQAPRPG